MISWRSFVQIIVRRKQNIGIFFHMQILQIFFFNFNFEIAHRWLIIVN